MYGKLFALFALAAVALAREYPAGLHPAVCPDYPFCNADALAKHTPQGMPIPEWVRNPGILPIAQAASNAVPKYPADFPAALCPNYPYCW